MNRFYAFNAAIIGALLLFVAPDICCAQGLPGARISGTAPKLLYVHNYNYTWQVNLLDSVAFIYGRLADKPDSIIHIQRNHLVPNQYSVSEADAYTYDAQGRVTEQLHFVDNMIPSVKMNYSYNSSGKIADSVKYVYLRNGGIQKDTRWTKTYSAAGGLETELVENMDPNSGNWTSFYRTFHTLNRAQQPILSQSEVFNSTTQRFEDADRELRSYEADSTTIRIIRSERSTGSGTWRLSGIDSFTYSPGRRTHHMFHYYADSKSWEVSNRGASRLDRWGREAVTIWSVRDDKSGILEPQRRDSIVSNVHGQPLHKFVQRMGPNGWDLEDKLFALHAIYTYEFDNDPVAVNEVAGKAPMLEISPVPASWVLSVRLNQAENGMEYRLRMIDLQGRQVSDNRFNTASESLDVSNVPSGVYLIEVSDKHGAKMVRRVSIAH